MLTPSPAVGAIAPTVSTFPAACQIRAPVRSVTGQSEVAGAARRSVEVTTPFSSIEMSKCFSPPKINSGM